MRSLRVRVGSGLVVLAAGVLVAGVAYRAVGGPEKKESAITATELTRTYATDPAEFDKRYKGKELVIEGVVTNAAAQGVGEKKPLVMLAGYQKPKSAIAYSVRVLPTSPLEGIRIGHKIRVRGVCQGHKDTLLAAELRDAKLVRVFADDYPPSEAVKAELKRLRGSWKIIEAQAGDKKIAPENFGLEGFSIEGRQLRLDMMGKRTAYYGLVVDPAKTPKAMDWTTSPDKNRSQLIYDLNGKRLRLAMRLAMPAPNLKGSKRPEGFDPTKHPVLLITAERQN